MTAVPDLTGRELQILELIRGGASVQRVVAIGRYRKAWTAVHVGAVIGQHFGDRPVQEKPKKVRKVAECGTLSGYTRHRRRKERVCDRCAKAKREYQQAWAAKTREPKSLGPVWTPPSFTGHPTDVELTGAQVDVLGELCLGLSNPRIGRQLGMAENTVKHHLKGITAALGATDRCHAVAMVLSRQVVVHTRNSPRAVSGSSGPAESAKDVSEAAERVNAPRPLTRHSAPTGRRASVSILPPGADNKSATPGGAA